jgi:hypothetical protein
MADFTPTLATKTPGGYEVSGQLELLLDAVAAKIRSISHLTNVKVVPHYSADLWNYLSQILNKRLGMMIAVKFMPSGTGQNANGPCLRNTRLAVRIFENVLFNQAAGGKKISALTVAEMIAEALQGYMIPSVTGVLGTPTLWLEENDAIQEDTDTKSELPGGVITWEVRLKTGVMLKVDAAE